jgi:hypothetical protein
MLSVEPALGNAGDQASFSQGSGRWKLPQIRLKAMTAEDVKIGGMIHRLRRLGRFCLSLDSSVSNLRNLCHLWMTAVVKVSAIH